MDALAGYGSDDSSSSESAAAASQQQAQQALSGLLHYSDNDESSENEIHQAESNSSLSGGADRKRKRSCDSNAGAASTNDDLPPPPTSTNKSLIEWETDYTASYRAPPANVIQNLKLTRKLAALESSGKQSSVSWAQHLKSQHEFHNPHFFDNVVTHFGIEHPLQSNVPSRDFQLYEFDLPAAEEQARIRNEQKLQEQHNEKQQHEPSGSHVAHAPRYRRR